MKTLRFNRKDHPEFFKVLRSRVNSYFKDNEITKYANGQMIFKTVFMLALYFVPLILMLTGVVSGYFGVMMMWLLMGLGMSGIGLSVMHDANHGAYSNNPRVNRILGGLIGIIGGFSVNWKIQHNVLHHSYTNVEGFDEDLDNELMRFSPAQEHKPFHKYQKYYAPLLYGLMTIYWLISKDFLSIERYRKEDLLKTQNISYSKAMTSIIANKVIYFTLIILLPLLLVELPWWYLLIGFFAMHYLSGLLLAFIFQSAHVLEETSFFKAKDKDSLENSWAIHQLRTTANFAKNNKILSWYAGGLNYQIEHHLFPNICHIHYAKISDIVRSTAEEYGIPYYEHKTFMQAIRSHMRVINELGQNEPKHNLALVRSS